MEQQTRLSVRQSNGLQLNRQPPSCKEMAFPSFHPATTLPRSFVIVGIGPAYSEPQCWDHTALQCTCPGRGGELVGVCDVYVTCGEGGLSRSEQLVGYFYSAPLYTWPTVWLSPDWYCVLFQPVASPVYLLQPRQHGQYLDAARLRSQQRSQFIEDTIELSFVLPGVISLFITCTGIIWNNSFW